MQSSGDDGIVVFTFGTMIKNLTEERRNMFVSALGQIPQKACSTCNYMPTANICFVKAYFEVVLRYY